jgi:hypothetical protein
MRRYARIGWAVTAFITLTLGVQPASASDAKRKQKPDLYVPSAEFLPVGEDHALRGEGNILKFNAETQNRGKGAAKRSKTEIVFVPYPAPGVSKPIHAFSLDVPKLHGATPYKYDSAFGVAKSPPLTFDGNPLGTYQAYWCADAENKIKESNERNNCVVPGGDLQRLFLGKRRWTGTVSGSLPAGDEPTSAHEDWTSTNAELEFERVDANGFHYLFNGTVSWTIQGTDADHCVYNGSGQDTIQGGPGNGDIELAYTEEEYAGTIYSDLDYTYPYTMQCPGETFDQEGPSGIILSAFKDENPVPMPFGTEVLAGTQTDVQGVTWSWEFH